MSLAVPPKAPAGGTPSHARCPSTTVTLLAHPLSFSCRSTIVSVKRQQTSRCQWKRNECQSPSPLSVRSVALIRLWKCSTRSKLRWRRSAIELVEPLPTRNQIALGGAPRRNASCRKSESFETMTYPCLPVPAGDTGTDETRLATAYACPHLDQGGKVRRLTVPAGRPRPRHFPPGGGSSPIGLGTRRRRRTGRPSPNQGCRKEAGTNRQVAMRNRLEDQLVVLVIILLGRLSGEVC